MQAEVPASPGLAAATSFGVLDSMKQISSQIAPDDVRAESSESDGDPGRRHPLRNQEPEGGQKKDDCAHFLVKTVATAAALTDCITIAEQEWLDTILDSFLRRMVGRHISVRPKRRRPRRPWRTKINKRIADSDIKKEQARTLLRTAVRLRKIVKPDACENCKRKCNSPNLHGHHDDYDLPYDVKWLCVKCHTAEHLGA